MPEPCLTTDSTPIVFGVSLKLYLGVRESIEWAESVARIAHSHPAMVDGSVSLFVLPSLPSLAGVRDALVGTPVGIGAQDLFWHDRGAYTGGVSGRDLREAGCDYVEIGHAERRAVFGEDAAVTRRKLDAAVRNHLVPVLCVGEPVEIELEAAISVCVAQLESALLGVTEPIDGTRFIVAYEPEWAIGRRTPASAQHIAAVVAALRERLAAETWLEAPSVIYGGSAQFGMLTELGDAVDGLFLGRFAHDPSALVSMFDEAVTLR